MEKALADFRSRCPGVLGTWLVDGSGAVVSQELSPLLGIDIERISADLFDVLVAVREFRQPSPGLPRGGSEQAYAHDLVFSYDTAMLLLRPSGHGALVVVVEPDGNLDKVRSLSRLLMLRVARTAQRQLPTGL